MESERTSRGFGLFWPLLIGIALGVAGTLTLPGYVKPYLPGFFRAPVSVEGRVLEKAPELDRLLLKIVTEEGVVLATFTERQKEIALLVDIGDILVLEVETYDPFLQNPLLRRVRKPENWEEKVLKEEPAEPAEGKDEEEETPPQTGEQTKPPVG